MGQYRAQEGSIYKQEIQTTSCLLPLFAAQVKAGFPSPADDFMEQRLDLNEHLIQHPAATFFVRVDGDSMIGAGIHPGDILIVDRSLEPLNGRIVIAVIDGTFTVKRIRIGVPGHENQIFLEPENPAFPSIRIEDGSDFQVWGVVTYVIHKAIRTS
jgi:DNA polymerase V